MSDKTAIAWTDATWNPVTGCTKVSPGCAHCYAEALSHRFGRSFEVTLHPDRLDIPLRWRKPRRIFVCSMGDLFHPRVPLDFVGDVFSTMNEAQRHTFQILTKRPDRLRDIIAWLGWSEDGPPLDNWQIPAGYYGLGCLPNVWLGTSIENDHFLGRADALRVAPAAVRFVSAEPLLGPLVHRCATCGGTGHAPLPLTPGTIPCPDCPATGWTGLDLTGIDWLIVGGESGPGHRPMDPAWVRDLVERADAAGCAVFVKQASGSRPGQQGDLPDDLWARKGFPR